jgi:hypothetical protein
LLGVTTVVVVTLNTVEVVAEVVGGAVVATVVVGLVYTSTREAQDQVLVDLIFDPRTSAPVKTPPQ